MRCTSMTRVTGLGAAALLVIVLCGIGFDGELCGGRGGAKETCLVFPFLLRQLGSQTLVLFGETGSISRCLSRHCWQALTP